MEVSSSDLSFEKRIPSTSSSSSLVGLLDEFSVSLKRDFSVCTPAIVYSYEQETSTALVRPLVSTQEKNGAIRRDLIIKVTVLQHQSGSFFIHNPLNVGDTGWLIAADRDTDLVKNMNCFVQGPDSGIGAKEESTGAPISNQGTQESQNNALHEFSQGFFIPDKWGGIIIPDALKDSFVIQQINPDHSSNGGFVLDKNGSIHIISCRHKDVNDAFVGGMIDIDLRYKKESDGTNEWDSGEIVSFAHNVICGTLAVKDWKDEDGKSHGGNLAVAKSADIKENLKVEQSAEIVKDFKVGGRSDFRERVVVKTDNKAAIIDPKSDLHKTDAKFREVTVVTGFKKKEGKVVKLATKKMRVLSDIPENAKDTEFEVGEDNEGGGGSGGDVLVDDKSIQWNWNLDGSGNNKLSVKGWHDQAGESLSGSSLADLMILDHDEDHPSEQTETWQVLVRDHTGYDEEEGGGRMRYVPLGHYREPKYKGGTNIEVIPSGEGKNTFIINYTGGGGGGDDSDGSDDSDDGVQFTGTDDNPSDRAKDFSFKSEEDSNVTVKCDKTTIKIGVYYL